MLKTELKKQTKFIAIASLKQTQEQGVFSVIAASMFHYKMGYNVILVDCNYPDNNIYELREKEIKMIDANDNCKQMYIKQQEQLQKLPYPILCSPTEDALALVNKYLSECDTHVDIVIFDLPCTIQSISTLSCITSLDHIFTPITLKREELEYALSFAITLTDQLISKPEYMLKSIHLFWNMVDDSQRNDFYEIYNGAIMDLGLSMLNTSLGDNKVLSKKLRADGKLGFLSTLFAPNPRLISHSRVDLFIAEILQTIKLEHNE